MKQIAFAGIFAVVLAAGAAQAQAPLAGTGQVPGGAAILGGGSATISGGGDTMTIVYSTPGGGGGAGLPSQPGRPARFGGSQGDGQVVEYLAPAPAAPGREAWLVGGGDDAGVAYIRAR
ncbi:hypothetical protein [Roseicella aerolata]|uniref:Uncharacterized protein n=1 Tax=Roseicella aerolata TaxID=2883479 RepID=A0A9X1IF58_9PROT|nr:hypothetical protein [Roseicella aerolata]MCB4823564.1 hypothetical protein [Roseicella aerolata]